MGLKSKISSKKAKMIMNSKFSKKKLTSQIY